MSILTAVFIVFLALKLRGVIAWSWWLITSPIWGGLVWLLFVYLAILLAATFFKKRGMK